MPVTPDIPATLWELVAQVPRGQVTTYGQLALALGHLSAARWVGHEVLHHEHRPHDADCVCHRVVRATGELGEFVAGGEQKESLLIGEGIVVRDGAIELSYVLFGVDAFVSSAPLAQLAREQSELLKRHSLAPFPAWPETTAGVDISYDWREGVAGYALVEVATGELLWSTSIRRPVTFPYITGFLSYRELPLHLALLEEVRQAGRMADVLLVDGSGILHPRGAGIATHLGIVTDLPTIGVTKKLLCGCADPGAAWPAGGVGLPVGYAPAIRACDPVVHEGKVIGASILSSPKSARPIYVSPGHRIDVRSAVEITRGLLRGRRLPEPVYWADRLSRATASETT